MYTEKIHASDERSPSSPTMVGPAVDTIVWSSAPRNIAIIRPEKTFSTPR